MATVTKRKLVCEQCGLVVPGHIVDQLAGQHFKRVLCLNCKGRIISIVGDLCDRDVPCLIFNAAEDPELKKCPICGHYCESDLAREVRRLKEIVDHYEAAFQNKAYEIRHLREHPPGSEEKTSNP